MIYIIFGVLAVFLIYMGIAFTIYNSIFGKRNNGSSKLKYFTAKDFVGLQTKDISFKSNKGQSLKGKLYFYEDQTYQGLLVFVHGIGAGHLAYTTEINHFASLGFMVLSYDNTGSGISEGKSVEGFSQRVIDLKYCLDYIKKDKELNKYKLVLCGHSWGAFAVLNILNYDYDIKAVVAMAGFSKASASFTKVISRLASPSLAILGPGLALIEFFKFGKVANLSATKAFKKTKTKVLFLYGVKDVMLDFTPFENLHYENVEVIKLESKGHRVNITDEAVEYDTFREEKLNNLKKEYKNKIPAEVEIEYYKNLDYDLLVELDEKVMKMVDDFLLNGVKK